MGGAETVALDVKGQLYIADRNGLVMWAPYPGAELEKMAWVPGYPLGLTVDREGRLLIASAGVVSGFLLPSPSDARLSFKVFRH